MTPCLCQQRHRGGEKKREDDQDAHGIKGRVTRGVASQLVHCHDGQHKQDEDDASDQQRDEVLNTRS